MFLSILMILYINYIRMYFNDIKKKPNNAKPPSNSARSESSAQKWSGDDSFISWSFLLEG